METINCSRLYTLPAYKTLFNVKKNELINHPKVEEWVREVCDCSLIPIEKFAKIEVTKHFVAYIFWNVQDMRVLENMVKIFMLYFVLDDHTECQYGFIARDSLKCDEVWGQVIEMLDILSGEKELVSIDHWKPYVCLFYKTMERVLEDLDEPQRKRVIQFHRDYAYSSMEETRKIQSEHGFNSMDELIEIKKSSMAIMAVLEFLEYGYGIALNHNNWNDPDFQNILELSLFCILYANDFGSFEKEYKEQGMSLERTPNTVAQVVLRDKCSIEEALKKVLKTVNDYERKTIYVMNEFLSDSYKSDDQKKFVRQLDYLNGANYHCSIVLTRYAKNDE